MMKSLLAALSMYSKIPVPTVEWNEKSMKYAMCFFPVVGVVIGAFTVLIGMLLCRYAPFGDLFFAAVMTLLPVVITGGIHLDGLADTADALASHREKEKKLEILKDPHIGAFGVMALCLYFLCTAALWSEAASTPELLWSEAASAPGLLLSAACTFVLSRALSGLAVVTFPAAKHSGTLWTFQDAAARTQTCIVLALWALGSAALMTAFSWQKLGAWSLIVPAVSLAVFGFYRRMSEKNFGGITGDVAGWFLQVCELCMLAALVCLYAILA